MAYQRPRRASEPASTDPIIASENATGATFPHALNTRPSTTPPSDGDDLAPEEQWSVVHPSTRHRTHHGPFGYGQQDQTPTHKPRGPYSSRLPTHILRPFDPVHQAGIPVSTEQRLLHRIIRQHIDNDTAQLAQTRDSPVASGNSPQTQPGSQRSFTTPLRTPLIPGSVHPWAASRSPSSPEPRALQGSFYRPMSGIPTSSGVPSGRPQRHGPSAPTAGAVGTSISMVSGNSNFQGDFVATNDSTYNGLSRELDKVRLGFSPAYNGDPYLTRNRSADVPNELNCSLFLVNLPPDLTTSRLIAAVHSMGPTGRIYATHINAPEPDRQHYGCAAKVIFFERAAAHHFFGLCQAHELMIDGYPARVMWNRIKTAEQAHSRTTTRVLLVGGDRRFVNPQALTEYFRTKLQFQIDRIIPHADGMGGDNAVVEYRFGSFRCQAEAAKMALVREHPDVKCFFHPDPCDPDHESWSPQDLVAWQSAVRRRFHQHYQAGLETVPEEFDQEQNLGGLYDAADQAHDHIFR